MMKKLLLCLMLLGFNSPTLAVSNAVLSYKEWKSQKVQAALDQVSASKAELLRLQASGNLRATGIVRKQVEQLQWNLEVANDLSVTDYFVLYLSGQNQADRYQQAAQKLNTSEVAEVLEAYTNSLASPPRLSEK